MKKIVLYFFCFCALAYADSPLSNAFESFGIHGTNSDNPTLYAYHDREEPGPNAKRFFKQTILSQKQTFLTVRKILAQKGIPESFLWICMTESKFNPSTKAGTSVGVWQMVPYTSKLYGLHVSGKNDERLDVEKSTLAFSDYCLAMYRQFKRWDLVMLAYNCGDTRLRAIMHKTGSSDLNVLLDQKQKFLPKQTRIYFKRVTTLAAIAHTQEMVSFLERIGEDEGKEG